MGFRPVFLTLFLAAIVVFGTSTVASAYNGVHHANSVREFRDKNVKAFRTRKHRVRSHRHSHHRPGVRTYGAAVAASVPELDPSSGGSAIAFLLCSILILTSPRRRRWGHAPRS